MPLEDDGIDVDALEAALDRRRREARPRDPQLPQPGRLHALGGQARSAWSSSPPSTASAIFEDDPYRVIRFGAETAGAMLSLDDGRPGHPRVVVLEDGQPRRPRRLPARARREDHGARQARPTRPTSRRTCSPSRSSSSSARSGGLAKNIEFVNAALRERRDALVESLGEQIPEAEFVVPEGGYFLWLTCRRRRHRRAARGRRRRGRLVRRRPRLHARGRALEPAALVRQRPRRADPRGRRARIARAARQRPRRGAGLGRPPCPRAPLAAPSHFYVAVTPRLGAGPTLTAHCRSRPNPSDPSSGGTDRDDPRLDDRGQSEARPGRARETSPSGASRPSPQRSASTRPTFAGASTRCAPRTRTFTAVCARSAASLQ